MIQSTHRMRQALHACAGGALLFVAVPAGLVSVSRFRFGSSNPLSQVQPPWRWALVEVTAAASAPLADDVVVNALVRIGLCVIWFAIAAIAISVVREMAHMLRHRGMEAPRIRGLGWTQRVARWIAIGVVGALPISTLSSTAAAGNSMSPATALAHLAAPDHTIARAHGATSTQPMLASVSHVEAPPGGDASVAPVAQRSMPGRSTASPTHTVERGESVYAIALRLAGGDEARAIAIAEQILDLNLGTEMIDGRRFTTPALIQPGWELRLPSDIAAPSSPPHADPPLDQVTHNPDDAHGEIRHVVVPGETLTSIAERHLGDGGRWSEIWDANRNATMTDGRTFSDPDLIVAGWELIVPAATAPPVTAPPAAPPSGSPEESTGSEQVADVEPERDVSQAESAPEVEPAATESVDVATPSESATTTTSTTAPAAPSPDDAEQTSGEQAPTDAPAPIRLEHLGFIAAGILAVVGVRRRRVLRATTAHTRLPTPPLDVSATERRLRTADDGERGARLDVALRSAAHHLLHASPDVRIGSVRVGPDGTVTVRLTGAALVHAPWTATTSVAQTWTLPASVPIELLADDARRVAQPCIALGCVGKDADGFDVLVDFEAAGATVIDRSSDHADAVMRAVCAGVATTVNAEAAHFHAAALGSSALFAHPNGQVHATADDAIESAITATSVTASLGSDRTTFELRARRTGGEVWEPSVVLLGRDDEVGEGNRCFDQPTTGLATIVVGALDTFPDAGVRISATAGEWTLDGFGEHVALQPAGLTTDDLDSVNALLDSADQPGETPTEVALDVDTCSARLAESAPTAEFTPMPHEMIVSLMGRVGVTDRNGEHCAFERSKALELVTWLSTHRDGATRTAARTALWELDVRDATFANVVSDARRSLGRLMPPPDDEEWLARTLNESLPLHELVVTDADLIAERVDQARSSAPAVAVEVLRPAVEMVNGLPFAGTSYLWPDADGLTSNLVMLAITATSELAAHALSMGDTDLVFWATGQGLQVLPGHEELIGLRMRAHARSGDLAGVRHEWESYERVIVADTWSDGEPAPKLLDLRRQLLSPTDS